MSLVWCKVCDTRHDRQGKCPGELIITEAERHGWRVLVHTGSRSEAYGVLVAPTRDAWRARILTFPGMLWCVPGGRGTLKFVGQSAREAETAAIDFIKRHCEERGYSILGEPAMVEARGVADSGRTEEGSDARGVRPQRFLKLLAVRFGVDKPTRVGRTADLSSGGLFVVTDEPFRPDTRVKLRLEIEGFEVPLTGRVVWTHPKPEQGRQAGMGIQLDHPPAMYQRFVDLLRQPEPDPGS